MNRRRQKLVVAAGALGVLFAAMLVATAIDRLDRQFTDREAEERRPEFHPRQPGSSRRVITQWKPTYPPGETKADLAKWYDAIDAAGEGDGDQPAWVARVFLSDAISREADGAVGRKAYDAPYGRRAFKALARVELQQDVDVVGPQTEGCIDVWKNGSLPPATEVERVGDK